VFPLVETGLAPSPRTQRRGKPRLYERSDLLCTQKEKGEIRSPLVAIKLLFSYCRPSSSTVSPACTSSSAKTTIPDDAVAVTFRTTTSPTARRGRSLT